MHKVDCTIQIDVLKQEYITNNSQATLLNARLLLVLSHLKKGGIKMNQQVEVGIIGEYDPNRRYHIATNEALNHAAAALSVSLKSSWISTQSLSNISVESTLKPFHALLCASVD